MGGTAAVDVNHTAEDRIAEIYDRDGFIFPIDVLPRAEAEEVRADLEAVRALPARELILDGETFVGGAQPQFGASGLAAVWAESNTRADIFDALQRREAETIVAITPRHESNGAVAEAAHAIEEDDGAARGDRVSRHRFHGSSTSRRES